MYGVPGVSLVPSSGPGMPGSPLEQPKALFRYGEQSLWSTQMHVNATVLAGAQFRVFSTSLGRVGQGFVNALSIAETNLKEPGRIPNGVAYDCFGIAAQHYQSDNTADTGDIQAAVNNAAAVDLLTGVQYGAVLTWDFTQTQVDIAPFDLCGAGGGAFGAVATTTNNVDHGAMNNGAGAIWMYRKHPVALPGATTFSILLRYGTRTPAVGSVSIVNRIVLFGYYKNVIEIG